MSKRRAKGTGSITKMGTRKWRARYIAPDGTRPSDVFTRQADAIEWLDEQISTVRKNEYIAPSKQSLADWIDKYLDSYKSDAAAATKQSYQESKARLLKHAPDLMQQEVQKIDQPAIQQGINLVRAQVGVRTTEITRTLLNLAFEKALVLKMIRTNPVAGTEIGQDNEVKRAKYIDPDMLDRIIAHCTQESKRTREAPYHDILYFILRTGCRAQEARGLRIDRLTMNGCRFDNVIDRMGNNKRPKTKKSIRFIALPEDVLEMCQRRARESISGYIFETKLGRTMDHHNIARHLSNITDGKHSPHDLRHTFATNAIRNGADPGHLADYLGDDITTIYRVYVHSNQDDLLRVAHLAARPKRNVTELHA